MRTATVAPRPHDPTLELLLSDSHLPSRQQASLFHLPECLLHSLTLIGWERYVLVPLAF